MRDWAGNALVDLVAQTLERLVEAVEIGRDHAEQRLAFRSAGTHLDLAARRHQLHEDGCVVLLQQHAGLVLRYRYEFMPKGLVNRLTVRPQAIRGSRTKLTEEEFDTAHRQFKETGKPRLYVLQGRQRLDG